jgi:3'(2'), 5'-bisphosphate nucleotidase
VEKGVWGGNVLPEALQNELETAIRLAREAGGVIMTYYQTGQRVEHKPGDEPVTIADRAADDLIRAGLQAVFPADGLLTEESDDDLSRLEKERVWIVDPLDGTTEFIRETGDFVVQIALVVGHEPVLGVIYQPTTGRLYHARRGLGAYYRHDGRVSRLRVSTEDEPARMCLTASRSHFSPFIRAAQERLGIATVRRLGSVGLKAGLLARGGCDLYLATTVAKEWDICAPHMVLREAGGVMTNLCGEDLIYNQVDVVSCRGVIASNGQAHGEIASRLAPLLGDEGG